VAAGAEGCVHVRAAVVHRERFQGFGE
jgi:hypothetical protein